MIWMKFLFIVWDEAEPHFFQLENIAEYAIDVEKLLIGFESVVEFLVYRSIEE